jgi:hypothetical protein
MTSLIFSFLTDIFANGCECLFFSSHSFVSLYRFVLRHQVSHTKDSQMSDPKASKPTPSAAPAAPQGPPAGPAAVPPPSSSSAPPSSSFSTVAHKPGTPGAVAAAVQNVKFDWSDATAETKAVTAVQAVRPAAPSSASAAVPPVPAPTPVSQADGDTNDADNGDTGDDADAADIPYEEAVTPSQNFVYLLFPDSSDKATKVETIQEALSGMSVTPEIIIPWRNKTAAYCLVMSGSMSEKLWEARQDQKLKTPPKDDTWVLRNGYNVCPFTLRAKNSIEQQRQTQNKPLSARSVRIIIPTPSFIDNDKKSSGERQQTKYRAKPFFEFFEAQKAEDLPATEDKIIKLVHQILKPFVHSTLIDSGYDVKVMKERTGNRFSTIFINFHDCPSHIKQKEDPLHPHQKTFCSKSKFAIEVLKRILVEFQWPIEQGKCLPPHLRSLIVGSPLIQELRHLVERPYASSS